MVDRVDEVLVAAVGDAFETAFRITGGLALLAALVLVPLGARRAALGALAVALVAAVATPLVYARERDRLAPAPVVLADPCEPRDTPRGEGLTGALQTQALQMLDRAACDAGATREELVLAVLDPAYRRTYERRHGPIPPLLEILRGLLG